MKTVEEMAEEIVAAVRSRHNETVDPGVQLIVMNTSRDDAIALVASALRSARRSALEEAAEMLKDRKRADAIRLAAGELTAQEMRTAQAVMGGAEAALRSLADAGEEK